LDGVGATEFSEEGFVAPGHSKFFQEEFVWWVPGSKRVNIERIDFALFVKVEEVLFQGWNMRTLALAASSMASAPLSKGQVM
jgi:hypothetical protein